jgi:hypothetical protein
MCSTVLAGGPADKDTLTIGGQEFVITLITKQEYDKAVAPECPEDSDKRVAEYKDSITFKLKNRKKITFRNSGPSEEPDYEGEKYYYICELKSIGCWVGGHSGYETYNFFLVDELDGSITELAGFCSFPALSPNGKRLVCGSDFGNIAGVNAIYFFDVKGKQVVPAGQCTLRDWGFSDLKWESDTILLAQVFDGSKMSYIRMSPVEL